MQYQGSIILISNRYEELKHQLELAQEAAHEEDEEAELARATAAVARLTAPAAITDTDVRLAEELTNAAASNNRRARPRVSCVYRILGCIPRVLEALRLLERPYSKAVQECHLMRGL